MCRQGVQMLMKCLIWSSFSLYIQLPMLNCLKLMRKKKIKRRKIPWVWDIIPRPSSPYQMHLQKQTSRSTLSQKHQESTYGHLPRRISIILIWKTIFFQKTSQKTCLHGSTLRKVTALLKSTIFQSSWKESPGLILCFLLTRLVSSSMVFGMPSMISSRKSTFGVATSGWEHLITSSLRTLEAW